MYRQGDILLIPVHRGSTKCSDLVEPENGRVVLACGEVTGHAHSIDARIALLYAIVDSADRLLRVQPGALLMHEEHGEVPLPDGDYIPQEIRHVAD